MDQTTNMWLNPTVPGITPEPVQPQQMQPPQQQVPVQQPQPQEITQPQYQQPVQQQPVQQQPQYQQPAQPPQPVWNPNTGQWEFPQPQQVQPQPQYQQPVQQQPQYQMPQQVQPQQAFQQPVQQPMQPAPVSVAQQMDAMRNANASRASSGASLKISLAGVQVGNYNLLDPTLVYEGKVTKAIVKKNKNNDDMLVINLTVTSPELYRGTMVSTNINLVPEAFTFYRAALEAADLFDFTTEMPTLESAEEFVGKFLRFGIGHQEYPVGTKQMRNTIIGSFSKAFESSELAQSGTPNGWSNVPQQMQPPQQPNLQFTPVQQQPNGFMPPQPVPQPPQVQPTQPQPVTQYQQFTPPNGYTPPQQQPQQPVQPPNFGVPPQQ